MFAAGSALVRPPKEPNAEMGARAGEGSNMSKNGSGSTLARLADDMKEEDEKGEKREAGSGVVGDGALEVVAEVRFDELGVPYR